MSFDWNIWAKNFPVSYEVEEPIEKANMPLRVTISRAGQSVSLSPDELREVLRGLGETRLPWSAGRSKLTPELPCTTSRTTISELI